ncbi:hypothetical protein BR93DRAFT_262723 [Coniochaeta sp. PMI_546]|nr:hypothetical protein BR93DRAFT_262723 [Coniochaeta sp. PMI_546]
MLRRSHASRLEIQQPVSSQCSRRVIHCANPCNPGIAVCLPLVSPGGTRRRFHPQASWRSDYHGALGCRRHLHDLPGSAVSVVVDVWTAGNDACVALFLVHISLLERDTQTNESVVRGCGTGPLVDEEEEDVEILVRGAMVASYALACVAQSGCSCGDFVLDEVSQMDVEYGENGVDIPLIYVSRRARTTSTLIHPAHATCPQHRMTSHLPSVGLKLRA